MSYIRDRIKIISRLLKREQPEQGQSLVEMAIILPVLLLMFLGVFEVGWALRGYLTLVNMDREITRFSARGIYLDFESNSMDPNSVCATDVQNDPAGIGYCKVISHANQTLAGQLSMDYINETGNSSIIITYYDLTSSAAFNCDGDSDCIDDTTGDFYDCSRFVNKSDPNYNPGYNLASVMYPLLVPPAPLAGSPDIPSYYNTDFNITNTTAITKFHYHRGGPYFSRINPKDKVQELRGELNRLNCQLVQKKLPPTGDNVVIVETTYNQKQLVSLPFVTAFVPDPVPLYSHTAMRLTTDLRNTASDQACELVPFIFPKSAFPDGVRQGDELFREFTTGNAPGQFGFLTWDPSKAGGTSSQQELEDNLEDLSRVTEVYEEPDGTPANDNILNVNDFVNGSTGVFGNSINSQLDGLKNLDKVIFPLWNDTNCTGNDSHRTCPPEEQDGTGANAKFRIRSFVIGQVVDYNTTSNKGITIKFLGYDNSPCDCDPEEDGAACDPTG